MLLGVKGKTKDFLMKGRRGVEDDGQADPVTVDSEPPSE
jgi:hypothetical protein